MLVFWGTLSFLAKSYALVCQGLVISRRILLERFPRIQDLLRDSPDGVMTVSPHIALTRSVSLGIVQIYLFQNR